MSWVNGLQIKFSSEVEKYETEVTKTTHFFFQCNALFASTLYKVLEFVEDERSEGRPVSIGRRL